MRNKPTCILGIVLWAAALLLLLAAAFDILPISDNLAIFLALACFIVLGAIKKASGGSSCCK